MTHRRVPVSFIATDDAERARSFYCDVLGLELVETSPFALVLDDGGHTLRVQIVEALDPAPFTAHGWQVDDIAAEIERLGGHGVEFQRFEHLPQDDAGVWATPDGNKIAWFSDPCGNVLSFTEFAD